MEVEYRIHDTHWHIPRPDLSEHELRGWILWKPWEQFADDPVGHTQEGVTLMLIDPIPILSGKSILDVIRQLAQDKQRLYFNDGTWGYWMTDLEILEEGLDTTNLTKAITKWLIDRGLVNPRTEEITGVYSLEDKDVRLIHGKNR